MWLLYVVALILGGGLLLVQLLSGADHHVGELHPGLEDAHPAVGPGIVSTRSLTFGVAAFGMVGAPLHILGVLSPRAALVTASLAALAATLIAGFAFRTVGHPSASGAASTESLVGREGRVLLGCGPGRPGKIRVTLGGHVVDIVATTDEAIAAETARAQAEQELQLLRTELEKLRLECDVVLPADAARQAAEARARGEAASVLEQGRAAGEALKAVAAEWQAAGASGREVYLLQQLRPLVEAAVKRVRQAEIKELAIVDGGDGSSYAAFVANFPAAVARVMEQTARALGMDLETLLGRKAGTE